MATDFGSPSRTYLRSSVYFRTLSWWMIVAFVLMARSLNKNSYIGGKKQAQMARRRGLKSTFGELGVNGRLVESARRYLNWTTPTEIQAVAIPLLLQGRDVIAASQTGSGKTGAFLIPIIHRLIHKFGNSAEAKAVQALVLIPTRELGVQCAAVFECLAKNTKARVVLSLGGLDRGIQERELKSKPELIVATAGRIIDHMRNFLPPKYLSKLSMLVIDEADRLLQSGFETQLMELLTLCQHSRDGRQTALFSATINPGIVDIGKLALKHPVKIKLQPPDRTVESLKQQLAWIDKPKHKEGALLSFLTKHPIPTLVFVNYKVSAHRLALILKHFGIPTAELHGDLDTLDRIGNLEQFRMKSVRVLVSSDVGARGLDIGGLKLVINFDTPRTLKTYIHRVGRTARMGLNGTALTFFTTGDHLVMKQILECKKGVSKPKYIPVNMTAVKEWHRAITRWEPELKSLLTRETLDRQKDHQQKLNDRAVNMVKYHSDIQGRRKRTWFQTAQEKRRDKQRSAQEDGVLSAKENKRAKLQEFNKAADAKKRAKVLSIRMRSQRTRERRVRRK